MNIKILNINDRYECDKWESFVKENGYMYQSVKWYNIIKKGYNLQPLFLYLEDNSRILSLLPLFHVRLLPFLNELVSIPHFESGGIIKPEYYQYFLEYISKNFNIRNVKIYQPKECIANYPKNDSSSLFVVKVPKNMDDLYKYFRKRLKKSMTNLLLETKINIIKGKSEYFIKELYRLNVIKSKEFGTPHHSYNFIKSFVDSFYDNCFILLAEYENKIIGTSFIIFYNNIAYHVYHFIPHKYLKMKTSIILFFKLFKESLEKGMQYFSFGRSLKGSGSYLFKKKMHATEYPLYIYNFNFKNNSFVAEEIKTVNQKYEWIANIWRQIPTCLTNPISPFLRKWIY